MSDDECRECEFNQGLVKELRAELERVKRQAAAMREAIVEFQKHAHYPHPDTSVDKRLAFIAADKLVKLALAEDAGRNYLSREQIKPLVEALRPLAERAPDGYEYPKEWNTDPVFVRHVPYCELISALKALNHAKTLGL